MNKPRRHIAHDAHPRDETAWQGSARHAYPEAYVENAGADLLLQDWIGRFTGHVSPATLGLAWQDWASHMLLSPEKQFDLVLQGQSAVWKWLQYGWGGAPAGRPGPVQPLPQDKRFVDPEWQQWPYNLISQGFLLQQQWWHRATTSVRGMSSHHTDVVMFVARQLLDSVAPSNFIFTNPVVQRTTIEQYGLNLLAGAMRAAGDGWRALSGEVAPNRFRPGHEVAATPGVVVMRNHLVELLRYDPVTPTVHSVPLLIVPAWIMKYYILDLSPENSLVRYLVEQGHTVYMISWKNPQEADRGLGMDDYLRLGVMDAIDAVASDSGAARINACGYCLGGTLLSIAAAAMARDGDTRLNSLTLLAAQVDFTEPGELSLFIDESEVAFLEATMWHQGYLDTRQMAGAFQLLRSNDLIWSRSLHQYLLNRPDKSSDLMSWNADATRMPFRMHSEYLRSFFLRNELANARYEVGDAPVALTDIEVPIFAVATLADHVAPWRSVYKVGLLTDAEMTFLLTTKGHNSGIVSPPGAPWRSYQVSTRPPDAPYIDPDRWATETPSTEGSWWEAWNDWLLRRSGPRRTPPASPGRFGPAPGNYVQQS